MCESNPYCIHTLLEKLKNAYTREKGWLKFSDEDKFWSEAEDFLMSVNSNDHFRVKDLTAELKSVLLANPIASLISYEDVEEGDEI